MGELLIAAVVAVLFAVPAGLTVIVFVTTRALVVGERRRLAGLGLAGALVVVAYGLASFFGGVSSLSGSPCTSAFPSSRNLEGASIEQSTGAWPPGLVCRYEFRDGAVESHREGFDGVWVATAITAVFGASMGVVVVTRQTSKKGAMLF